MRIVVTGGSGKGGAWVVRDLREHGHDVLNVDVRHDGSAFGLCLVTDLTDLGQTLDALAGADAVVHFAAIPAPQLRPEGETFRINALSTYNVFAAAVAHGLRRVVWASSETVLGLPFDVPPAFAPIDESIEPRPESSYALSKLVGETMATQFARRSGIGFVGLRISNIMEPPDYALFPSYWDDPHIRKWNLWGYVDARDVAQAARLGLDADVEGSRDRDRRRGRYGHDPPKRRVDGRGLPERPAPPPGRGPRHAPLHRPCPQAARLRTGPPLGRPRRGVTTASGRAGRPANRDPRTVGFAAMRIREIRAVGLYGATPEGGWSNELRPEDSVHTLVAVVTEEGPVGYGSAFTNVDLVRAALAQLEPLYRGASAIEPERTSEILHQHTFWLGRGGTMTHAISAIDIALWDLLGQTTGQPVGRLLGGRYRERVRPYASILMREPEPLAAELERLTGAGFRAFKLGWGPFGRVSPAVDESIVRRAREAVGPEVALMVDAGGSDAFWPHGYAWALRTSEMLAEYGVAWFEEPLAPDALADYQLLREHSRVPIAGGEVLTRRQAFLPWLQGHALDIVQPDATKVGGI